MLETELVAEMVWEVLSAIKANAVITVWNLVLEYFSTNAAILDSERASFMLWLSTLSSYLD